MANKNADIRLLIGAEGGSSTGGALIKQELQSYFKDGLKIKIRLDDVDIGSIKARVAEQQKSVSNTKAELDINKQLEKSFERAAALRKKTDRTDELKQAAAINKYLEKEYQLKLKSQQAAKQAMEQYSQQYWDGRFKDSVNDLTASNTVLKQMSQYYKELEKSSTQVAVNTEKERAAQEKLASTAAKISANAVFQKASFQQYLQTLNPSALGQYNTEIQSIFKNLEAGANGSGEALQNAQNGMKSFKATMKEVGAEGKNVFTYLEGKIRTFAVYLMSSAITIGVVSGFQKAVGVVYDLNDAMVNLRIVTGDSVEQTKELLNTYNQMAQRLGTTTKNISSGAIEWQRQGFNEADTNRLLEASTALSVVGMVESADAAKYLTSAIKGYKQEASSAMDIVDKLTSIDLKAAVSAGGLAEAMARTANSARLVGVDMDTLLGYIAAVGEATQREASVVGEAFKRIFARYSNVKLGKLIDDETGESLSDYETVLNSIGVTLRDQVTGNFRDFNVVLSEVVDKYKQLDPNSAKVSALAQALGGTLQRENVLALFENYDKAMQYAETAANSTGTAMQKLSTYQEGLEAKQNKLTASFEKFSNSILSDDLVGLLLDLGSGVLNFASGLGGIPVKLAAITVALVSLSSAMKALGASSFGTNFIQTFKDMGEPTMTGFIAPSHRKEAA